MNVNDDNIIPFNFYDFLHYSYRSKIALPGKAKSGEDTESESRSASQKRLSVQTSEPREIARLSVVVLRVGRSLGGSRQVGSVISGGGIVVAVAWQIIVKAYIKFLEKINTTVAESHQL